VLNHASNIVAKGVFCVKDGYAYSGVPSFLTEDSQWQRHTRSLQNETDNSARGGGYWFWKPNLMLHHLKQNLEDGNLLIYADNDWNDLSFL
jgi:hypothetical protein